MHCPKAPGARNLPDTQQILGRGLGICQGREMQREGIVAELWHRGSLGIAGYLVPSLIPWGNQYPGSCRDVFQLHPAWLNTMSRIALVFQEF